MKIYKKLLIIGVLILVTGIGIRIWYVNKNTVYPEVEFYNMQEYIPVENDIFWNDENAKGYSIKVNSAKIMSLDEFVSEHGLENLENAFTEEAISSEYPEMIVDVKITIKNSNLIDMGDLTGAFVAEYRLIDKDCRISRDPRLFAMCNPTVGTASNVLIRPDSEMEIDIPFGFSPNDKVWPIPEKRIRDGKFSLAVSLYPVRKVINIDID